jgi:hypothetical protein
MPTPPVFAAIFAAITMASASESSYVSSNMDWLHWGESFRTNNEVIAY